jgi:UDP-glucose 4-epimerase
MARALVLGANGYAGRHLVSALTARGHEVTAAGLRPQSIDGHSPYLSFDIRRVESFPEKVADHDLVFFFCGLTGTSRSILEYQAFVETNDIGLLHLLDFLRKLSSRARVIFPSSRLVYAGQPGALPEDARLEAKTIYAASKIAGESYLAMHARCFDTPFTVLRICVVYGNEMGDRLSYGTLNHFLTCARNGRPVSVYGTGEQRRTFIHVCDLSRIIIEAATHPGTRNGIFNIGGADVLSIAEAAELIARRFGVATEFREWPALDAAVESGDTVFDDSRLSALLPLQYEVRFQDWVARLE